MFISILHITSVVLILLRSVELFIERHLSQIRLN